MKGRKKYGDLDKAYPIRKKLNKNHAKQMWRAIKKNTSFLPHTSYNNLLLFISHKTTIFFLESLFSHQFCYHQYSSLYETLYWDNINMLPLDEGVRVD